MNDYHSIYKDPDSLTLLSCFFIFIFRFIKLSKLSCYFSTLIFLCIYLVYLYGIMDLLINETYHGKLDFSDYLEMILILLFITSILWLSIKFKPINKLK